MRDLELRKLNVIAEQLQPSRCLQLHTILKCAITLATGGQDEALARSNAMRFADSADTLPAALKRAVLLSRKYTGKHPEILLW